MSERGWDRFLTQQDREVLAAAGRVKTEQYGLGERPALLLVDFYYASLGKERLPIVEAVRKWPMACGSDGWEAVDQAAKLLEMARVAEIPVVHITLLDFPTPWARGEVAVSAERTSDELDDAYEIIPEVAPTNHELVIRKTAPSAFQGTPLSFFLAARNIDSVIVCGESTSGCVRATVVDAVTQRFKVGIVEDACFDRTESSHWINLFDMDQKYGDVLTTDQALKYISEVSPGIC